MGEFVLKFKGYEIDENFSGNLLKNLILNKGIQFKNFFYIAIQLIDILDEIHKNKVIHLNINPNNILINDDGEIKIIDFSSTMLITAENQEEKNLEQLQGTLEYIAPELTGRINKVIDYRTDYYSLGITFYELLTGKLPFNNSDKLELIYAHIAKEAIPPVKINDSIPQVLSNIIMKLIAKMPEDRYQSLTGLKMDIKRCEKSFETKGNIEHFKIGEKDICNNFQIPAKLYGKEKALEELYTIFEKVKDGAKELLLIEGNSGVGKSTFVNQIHNKIVESSVYFISGKFEQFQKEVPYNGLIQILENFINQLLMKSSEELALWRQKILQAVGNNIQVIIDVIPSLKIVIGQQYKLPELRTVETQNRFNLVFQNFMRVIAQKEHPLVIFIDDLQWADSASLNFIKMIMIDKSIEYLLVIGSYRDDKKSELKPLMMVKNELIKDNVIINTIKLNALKKNDLELLVKDTLKSLRPDLFEIKELVEFMYNKTQGNPFFVKQFLQTLYQKEYIWFDYDLMQWCLDITQIKKLDITENVIELLLKRIKTLKISTREDLMNAACIGNQFDLQTLALISNKSLDYVMADLQLAINEGLITIIQDGSMNLSQGNIKFEFLHDRIQLAIYSLITDEIRQLTHLNIGRLLLRRYSSSITIENIFELVRHINIGKSHIISKVEFIRLAELNLKAGIGAKRSSAYKAAFIYFKTGIEILSSNPWEEYYELTLQLYLEITEMAYLISDYKQMYYYVEIILQNAKTLTDKVKAYNIKIQAYQAELKLHEALETGIFVLELMGIDIPLNPKQNDINKAFANVKEAMAGMEVEDFLNFPSMNDPIKLGAMEIMLSTTYVTYKAAPMLTPILTCKMVELSIKYGNSPLSPGAYTFYGLLLCTVINDIELGSRIGKVSINLIEMEKLKQYKAIVLDMNCYSIKHWKEHLKSTLDPFSEGFRAGVENGNFENAACCLAGHAKNSFYIGRSLEILEEEISANIKIIEKIKKCSSLNYERIFAQLVLNMQGKSKNPVFLTGEMCDEKEMLSIVSDMGDMVGIFFFFLSKTILYYHFREYSLAALSAKKAEENLAGVAGMFDIAVLYYFDSLSRLALYHLVSNEEKEKHLIKVSQNQEKLKYWSKYAPMNFLHKFYLVEAERLRVTYKTYEAIEYYDKAISMAKEHEYLNDEALANELAGQFWLDKNNYRYAKLHLREAYLGYKYWGAEAKAKDIQNKYPKIFNEELQENTNKKHTTRAMSELMDINTIMKASQAISEEIVLDELIKKLIKSIIENVGAEKAVFIMKKADSFIIKGAKESTEEKITVFQDTKLSEYENIPKSIINYVSRTNKSIILENSIDSINFRSDKYVAKGKPKSILCFPLINKKDLKGIIYLENNLMTGAFTKERLKILEILSSQIVISLENSNLYEDLENSNEILDNKVKERTSQLEEERDKLKKYLDIAEVLFLVLDKDGKVVSINRKGCEILGYNEEEILGKIWYENFIHEKDREKTKTNFEKSINGEVVEHTNKVIVTKTGEERITYNRNTLLRDKEGNVEGLLSCTVDVTEYNMLREQLEYNKLKLEFFANLSHELKTPLNVSFCALQMLNLYRNNNVSSEVNEKLDKYANIIKQNDRRLLRLVNNIVDITKINSNSFDLILHNHDIVDIIKNITFSVSDYVENKNRILEFYSNIKSKVIACDPFSIERIILNLLSNAIKFTDEGDKISVNIYGKKDSIIVEVKDTGIGIPKNKQKMIFERFRQVDKSFTRNSEGSGLGLTIVKLLTKLHQGGITVESTVGEFTKFIINLPVKEIEEQNICTNNCNAFANSLIDRIDVEFSDVYGL